MAALPASVTNLVTFGDSITDSGATPHLLRELGYDASFGFVDVNLTPPEDGYWQNRFTNYYNAADYVSIELEGQVATSREFGGDNYSYGGTTAADQPILFDTFPPFQNLPDVLRDFGQSLLPLLGVDLLNLGEQVGRYLSDVGGSADPGSLHVIHMGGNDVHTLVQAGAQGVDLSRAIESSADAILDAVMSLHAAGAEHVLFAGISNPGITPRYVGRSDNIAAATSVAGRIQDAVGR
ncbi:MAG: hypothetical protein GY937_09155 [bacterium]|nr:hypothetical protein [bacterium]